MNDISHKTISYQCEDGLWRSYSFDDQHYFFDDVGETRKEKTVLNVSAMRLGLSVFQLDEAINTVARKIRAYKVRISYGFTK